MKDTNFRESSTRLASLKISTNKIERGIMQIITCDNISFPDLLEAWKGSKVIGTYWRNGNPQKVSVTTCFLLVSPADQPNRIAIKPARSIGDAEHMAKRLLDREKERGSAVELVKG